MSISEKGKKGFQSINIEDKKSSRVSAYITKNEAEKWQQYLSKNNLKSTEVIREFILTLI
jgi:hypothetical protein|tara:strand:+ start:70 stop:249 length:180 start_codon:yes stop_codon:yes gene_type:complete